MATKEVALRKRQQIAKANRTMFTYVAGVSVVVGAALVVSVFLFQKATFNEKVLSVKSKTASTLEKNNKIIDELQNQVRILNTNEDLKSVMIPGESQPVQVVLDALPSEANSSAFGSSLQQKLLDGDGVSIESIVVDPVTSVEVLDYSNSRTSRRSKSNSTTENRITFSFVVSAHVDNSNALKNVLARLERSIRPIKLTSNTIEVQGDRLSMTAIGYTSYQPSKTVELTDKVVKP